VAPNFVENEKIRDVNVILDQLLDVMMCMDPLIRLAPSFV